MIEITNLVKNYKTVQALRGIDLRVESGELFAYLGPNGAGKTTTIRILTGLTRLTRGAAMFYGHDIEENRLEAKKQYSLVPQHINLDSELTVYENLFIHGRLYHMERRADQQFRLCARRGLCRCDPRLSRRYGDSFFRHRVWCCLVL